MDYIVYFVITIGILVFVHEFGHFAAAKLCKMRADVFAIGFGKRLFGWNKINGFTWGDLPKDFDGKGHTDYRLSLLPLGGYVKIAGMVDESFDTDFADKEPEPYEFRAKPTYQKLFVITAGVMMNLTLTLAIFWGINFFQGKQIIGTTNIGYVTSNSKAAELGFQTNDKILSVNGEQVDNWASVVNNMLVQNMSSDANITLERNGENLNLEIPKSELSYARENGLFIAPEYTQPYVDDVLKNSPAMDAGIKSGDIFLSLNNRKLNSSQEATNIIETHSNEAMPLTILRGQDTVRTTVTAGADGKIGIIITDVYTGPYEYKSFGFFGSLTQGVTNIGQYTYLTFTALKGVITGQIEFNQAFGGPVKIAQYAAKSADNGIQSFLFFLAMLSLSLAIINILPFPVLDGGHFVIIAIEGLLRKELPLKVKIAIQNAGFVVLLLLMAFIIYSDIISL